MSSITLANAFKKELGGKFFINVKVINVVSNAMYKISDASAVGDLEVKHVRPQYSKYLAQGKFIKIFQPRIELEKVVINEESHVFLGKPMVPMQDVIQTKANDLSVVAELNPKDLVKTAIALKIVKKKETRKVVNEYGESFVTRHVAKDCENNQVELSIWQNHRRGIEVEDGKCYIFQVRSYSNYFRISQNRFFTGG